MRKNKTLPELLQEFSRVRDKLEILNNEIGELIVWALRDIIPDLKHSAGWEPGVDTVCFFSKSRSASAISDSVSEHRYVDLVQLLLKIDNSYFNNELQAGLIFETPFGVYLKPKEAKQARQRLLELFGVSTQLGDNPNGAHGDGNTC